MAVGKFFTYGSEGPSSTLSKYFGASGNLNIITPNSLLASKGSDCPCRDGCTGLNKPCNDFCCNGGYWANQSLAEAGLGDIPFNFLGSQTKYYNLLMSIITTTIERVGATEISANIFDTTVYYPIGTPGLADNLTNNITVNGSNASQNIGVNFKLGADEITSKWGDGLQVLVGYVPPTQIANRVTFKFQWVNGGAPVVEYNGGAVTFWLGNTQIATFTPTGQGGITYINGNIPAIKYFTTEYVTDSLGTQTIVTTPLYGENGIPFSVRCSTPTIGWVGEINVEGSFSSSGSCWACDNCGGGAAKYCDGVLWSTCEGCGGGSLTGISAI
jgi:hypothetical protein